MWWMGGTGPTLSSNLQHQLELYHHLMVQGNVSLLSVQLILLQENSEPSLSNYNSVSFSCNRLPYLLPEISNSLKTSFCYPNGARHSYWEWLYSTRQMSSDTIDHLPTRASVQLSEAGRGELHRRQMDTRPSALGRNKTRARRGNQGCSSCIETRMHPKLKSKDSR